TDSIPLLRSQPRILSGNNLIQILPTRLTRDRSRVHDLFDKPIHIKPRSVSTSSNNASLQRLIVVHIRIGRSLNSIIEELELRLITERVLRHQLLKSLVVQLSNAILTGAVRVTDAQVAERAT